MVVDCQIGQSLARASVYDRRDEFGAELPIGTDSLNVVDAILGENDVAHQEPTVVAIIDDTADESRTVLVVVSGKVMLPEPIPVDTSDDDLPAFHLVLTQSRTFESLIAAVSCPWRHLFDLRDT